jgi:hypothetical protein
MDKIICNTVNFNTNAINNLSYRLNEVQLVDIPLIIETIDNLPTGESGLGGGYGLITLPSVIEDVLINDTRDIDHLPSLDTQNWTEGSLEKYNFYNYYGEAYKPALREGYIPVDELFYVYSELDLDDAINLQKDNIQLGNSFSITSSKYISHSCKIFGGIEKYQITFASTSSILNVSAEYVFIDSVSFLNSNASSNASCILLYGASSNNIIQNCVFNTNEFAISSSCNQIQINDCVFNFVGSADSHRYISLPKITGETLIYNNTFNSNGASTPNTACVYLSGANKDAFTNGHLVLYNNTSNQYVQRMGILETACENFKLTFIENTLYTNTDFFIIYGANILDGITEIVASKNTCTLMPTSIGFKGLIGYDAPSVVGNISYAPIIRGSMNNLPSNLRLDYTALPNTDSILCYNNTKFTSSLVVKLNPPLVAIASTQSGLDDAVLKSVLTTQVLSGDLNLPSSIGNVNVGAELGLVITQANGNTGNISILQGFVSELQDKTQFMSHDPIGSTTFITPVIVDSSLTCTGNITVDGTVDGVDVSSLNTTVETNTNNISDLQYKTQLMSQNPVGQTKFVGGVIIDASVLQINGSIFDANEAEAFLLKKAPGPGSYSMGLATTAGTDINSLSIGYFIGDATHGKSDNILIGNTVGTTMGIGANSNVLIGTGCAPTITGDHNVVIGRGAGSISVDARNTYVGGGSGIISTGSNNSCLGSFSGLGISSGNNNTMLGCNTSTGSGGSSNQIAVGYQAETTTSNQCVIGNTELTQVQSDGFRDLDVKSDNILAIGKSTASKVEIGRVGAITEIKGNLDVDGTYKNNGQNGILAITSNGGTGTLTLSENNLSAITGGFNTVIGNDSGTSLIGGTENTIIGYQAGQGVNERNTVCIGYLSGQYTNGSNNTFIGTQTGQGISTGSDTDCNVAIGSNSMRVITTGDNNVAIGCNSASTLTEGIRNVCIGDFSALQPTLANQIAIGYLATTTDNNQCVIGNTALAQVQSDGFRDLDVKSDNILAIGKSTASKVEIGKVSAITEIKGNLTVPSINTLTPVGGKYSQTINKTVANIATETTLINTSVGSRDFLANTFAIGDTYSVRMSGKMRSQGSHNLTLRIKIGDTVIARVMTINVAVDTPIDLDFIFTVPTIGSALSGTLKHRGIFYIGDTRFSITQTNPILFDTTILRVFDITIQWAVADADNTITAETITVSKIY